MTELIDIGANLTSTAFDLDRDDVIRRAVDAGVTRMIATGTSVGESKKAADLAEQHRGVLWSTAGVHPHDARLCDESTIPALRELARGDQVVAIGECGLDFNRNHSPQPTQKRWFEAQVDLAAELSMPLFVHERDAAAEVYEILGRYRPRLPAVVVHCFTGERGALETYLEMDVHIGITGWICDERRGGHLHDLVGLIGDDRLMVETDAPYLLPRTIRPRPKGRRNEPAHLPHVVDVIAAASGRTFEEVAGATMRTAEAFFGLS